MLGGRPNRVELYAVVVAASISTAVWCHHDAKLTSLQNDEDMLRQVIHEIREMRKELREFPIQQQQQQVHVARPETEAEAHDRRVRDELKRIQEQNDGVLNLQRD